MMIDTERTASIIADLGFYLSEYQRFAPEGVPDFNDKKTYYAVSMVLFTVLNLVIDLGEELVAGLGTAIPSTYRDIFRLLQEAEVIGADMATGLVSLVYYRNRLSHRYADFDESDLRAVIERIPLIEEFARCARQHI